MTKKPTSLQVAVSKKPTAPAPATEAATEVAGEPETPEVKIRTMTLRLPEPVHDVLREMAYTQRRSQHAFVMEALSDFFVKSGKGPIKQ